MISVLCVPGEVMKRVNGEVDVAARGERCVYYYYPCGAAWGGDAEACGLWGRGRDGGASEGGLF